MYHGPISFALRAQEGSSGWQLAVYPPNTSEGERYRNLSLEEALDVAGACLLHYVRECDRSS